MPPKADQPPPPPTDLPGILRVLGGEDQSQYAVALGVLLSLDAKQLPAENAVAEELLSKLVPLLSSADAAVQSAAVRNIARLLNMPGPCQAPLTSEHVAQGAWGFCASFAASFDTYKAAVTKLMEEGLIGPKADAAAAAAGAKKAAAPAKGAPPAADPETTLPGPTKHAVDAALRILATLCVPPATSLCLGWLAGQTGQQKGEDEGGEAEGAQTSCAPVDLTPLLLLLEHHSPRVQMRAARLTGLLTTHAGMRQGLLRAGAVLALVQLLGSTMFGAVRLECIQALQRIASTPGPQHVQLLEAGACSIVLRLMLNPDSISGKSQELAHVSGGGAPPATPPPPTPVDFNRPQVVKPADLCTAAARLLVSMAFFSHAAAEQVAQLGGLGLLMRALPGPTAPSGGAAASAPPAAAPTLPASSAQVEAGGLQERAVSSVGQPIADEWTAVLKADPAVAPAAAPLPSSQAQALALTLVAHLLSVPGLQDALYVAAQEAAYPQAGDARTEEGADGAVPAVTPPADAAVPVPQPHAAAMHELLLHFFSPVPPAAPPPPPDTAAAKGAKKDEKPKAPAKGKDEPPPPPPLPVEHLSPPFAPVVRAAALDALSQLAAHPGYSLMLIHNERLREVVQRLGHSLPTPPPPLPPPAPVAAPPPTTPPGGKPATPSKGAAVAAPAASGIPPPVEVPQGQPTPEVLQVEAPIVAPLASLLQRLGPQCASQDATEGGASSEGGLMREDVVSCLSQLAAAVRAPGSDMLACTSVASAVLALPESAFTAPPRPPLPSPPPTPPPPPLATSMFIWDGLDRPMMTDGSVRLVHM